MPDLTQGSRHTRRRGTQPDGGRFVGDPNAFSGMGTAVPFIQSTLGNLWGEQQHPQGGGTGTIPAAPPVRCPVVDRDGILRWLDDAARRHVCTPVQGADVCAAVYRLDVVILPPGVEMTVVPSRGALIPHRGRRPDALMLRAEWRVPCWDEPASTRSLAPLRRVAQTHTIALSLLVDALSPDDVLHHSIRYTLSQMTRYWTAQNTTFGDR